MSPLSRRRFLAAGAAGAVGLVATGCAPEPAPTPTATPVGPPDWSALAARIGGSLARPGDADYDSVRVTENPRWDDARPLAVLTAGDARDVAAGLAFATRYRLPIALRSGGHSYPGYSAGGAAGTGVKPSLVIDSRGMTAVALAADNTVRIGAGASLAQVYDGIGAHGRAIAGGSCATVGITGLTLGGGVGVLVRAYGLTCDSLTEVEIVTADARVLTANAITNPDLFWACRGGGGGHLGVVTALTFATKPAPEVTMFSLSWAFASASAVITAWQAWAPAADARLWSTLKLLNGPAYTAGPRVFVSGTWLGDPAALDSVLAPFLASAGAPRTRGVSQHSYRDAMASYAGCSDIPVAACQTGPGGRLTRESFSATSHVAYTALDAAGIRAITDHVSAARGLPGLKEGGISIDALGGAVGDVAPDATAFPHRTALATVQYTATFVNGGDPAPFDAYVRGFRDSLIGSWGHGAYVNYADATLTDPAKAYFAGNAGRLAAIRSKYDPLGLFSQPQAY
ncbi:FAD-binding oxidoreductase [Lacisediminihabitans profunda]|uniref:FAD-dependent oxidoreductase n=1 Tax=Lacisediminihabitans profunda TaxID=2594790 RepID=A0A5C8UST1_9MICO|nr:FAD-binding protein [Lacisediminihabitans profunda]TXN31382.1 FAD-dependent oxidoreductase [Lacisediminihabitans profunda]